jgi:hypothetical protein
MSHHSTSNSILGTPNTTRFSLPLKLSTIKEQILVHQPTIIRQHPRIILEIVTNPHINNSRNFIDKDNRTSHLVMVSWTKIRNAPK